MAEGFIWVANPTLPNGLQQFRLHVPIRFFGGNALCLNSSSCFDTFESVPLGATRVATHTVGAHPDIT